MNLRRRALFPPEPAVLLILQKVEILVLLQQHPRERDLLLDARFLDAAVPQRPDPVEQFARARLLMQAADLTHFVECASTIRRIMMSSGKSI